MNRFTACLVLSLVLTACGTPEPLPDSTPGRPPVLREECSTPVFRLFRNGTVTFESTDIVAVLEYARKDSHAKDYLRVHTCDKNQTSWFLDIGVDSGKFE